ncbi:MAG TPA: helix-turn-helix domain-containing protein, partial [Candidatus Dormibacteraeota bacterium]
MAHPLRSMILDLLLERAATVAELAAAAGRPKSTLAHHVKVLVDAGMIRVVRTRRVRAIDERFYERTAVHANASPVPIAACRYARIAVAAIGVSAATRTAKLGRTAAMWACRRIPQWR